MLALEMGGFALRVLRRSSKEGCAGVRDGRVCVGARRVGQRRARGRLLVMVVSRCVGIGPPSGIPSLGRCFCWPTNFQPTPNPSLPAAGRRLRGVGWRRSSSANKNSVLGIHRHLSIV